jgi:hypothetical protein
MNIEDIGLTLVGKAIGEVAHWIKNQGNEGIWKNNKMDKILRNLVTLPYRRSLEKLRI